MIVIGALGYSCFGNDGFRSRRLVTQYERQEDDLIIPISTRQSDGSCDEYFGLKADKIVCLANSDKPDFLVIGDSHAMSLNSFAYLNENTPSTLLVAAHDCMPFERYAKSKKALCSKVPQNAKMALEKIPSIKTVVIAAYYPDDFADLGLIDVYNDNSVESQEEMFINGYKKLISDFIAQGKKVIFVLDNPRLDYSPQRCYPRPFRTRTEECKLVKSDVLKSQEIYRQKVYELKKSIPGLEIIDSLEELCDAEFCYGKDDKNIFYFDKHHLSISGSKKVLNLLD